jgi:hypothetical protein
MLMFLLSGTAVFANGDKFDGTYDMDRRHGFGVYAWKDGRIYEGEFYRDQRQGCGYVVRLQSVAGSCTIFICFCVQPSCALAFTVRLKVGFWVVPYFIIKKQVEWQ